MGRKHCSPLRLAALVAATVALASACAPPPPAVRARPTGWTEVVLTRDADDAFTLDGDADTLTLRADAGNAAGNTRIIAWRPSSVPTLDQESCVTVDRWSWPSQEGVALRVSTAAGRTRAITVTRNVWGHATDVFNVHLWDLTADEPYRLVASFDLAASLAHGSGPQRLCGRTDGPTISFKAWHTTEPEPAWDDPVAGRTLDLPTSWVYSGRPGVYVGHVEPGTSLSVTDVRLDGRSAPTPPTTTPPDTSLPTTTPPDTTGAG